MEFGFTTCTENYRHVVFLGTNTIFVGSIVLPFLYLSVTCVFITLPQ